MLFCVTPNTQGAQTLSVLSHNCILYLITFGGFDKTYDRGSLSNFSQN